MTGPTETAHENSLDAVFGICLGVTAMVLLCGAGIFLVRAAGVL